MVWFSACQRSQRRAKRAKGRYDTTKHALALTDISRPVLRPPSSVLRALPFPHFLSLPLPSFHVLILLSFKTWPPDLSNTRNSDRELPYQEGKADLTSPLLEHRMKRVLGCLCPTSDASHFLSRQPMRFDAPRQVGLKLSPLCSGLFCHPDTAKCRGASVANCAAWQHGSMVGFHSMSNRLLTNHTLEATELLATFPFLYMVIASSGLSSLRLSRKI
jgi:hypothetical protein